MTTTRPQVRLIHGSDSVRIVGLVEQVSARRALPQLPVVPVDAHVLVGQVARPHGRLGLARGAGRPAISISRLGERARPPLPRRRPVAVPSSHVSDAGEDDLERASGRRARRDLPDRHRHAAPVRVAAEQRGLARAASSRSRTPRPRRRPRSAAPRTVTVDELRGALAVADDHARELAAHVRATAAATAA